MVWNSEGEDKVKWSHYYPANLTDEQWREGWHKLQTSNTYDLPYIGDLAIVACAHSLKKDILVFNTPWQINDEFATDPIFVVSPNEFDPSNERDTEIPIVLLYNGVHFESSIPASEEDVQETIELVRNYRNSNYIIPESLKNDYKSKKSLVNENRQNAQHDKSEKTRNDANMKSSENVFGKKKGSYTKEGDVSSDTSNEPKVKVKDMTPEQLKEYWRSKKQNKRDQKRAMDEVKFKREMAEEKQNGRDQKRATDEANLKAKRAQEKQNERDQKRATDEANLKAKRAQEKQNERDQKRATDEVNLKAKRA